MSFSRPPKVRIAVHSFVQPNTGCWVWTGRIDRKGPGDARPCIEVGGAIVYAHRVSYSDFIGPLGDDLIVYQVCKNKMCVNPEHLRAATKLDYRRRHASVNKEIAIRCASEHATILEAYTLQRFHRMTSPEPTSGCWLWLGTMAKGGYGGFRLSGESMITAHRASYKLHRGPIADGLHVCHSCDVKCCVNPAHLFLGTNDDNVRDKMQKGRHKGGRQTLSHCPRCDNEYTLLPSGKTCIPCRRWRERRAYQLAKAATA